MEIDSGQVSIKSPQKIRVDFLPARTTLLPVVNRGRIYPIPTAHLGSPVDPMNVVSVAEAGAQFYQQFLAQADEFFVK